MVYTPHHGVYDPKKPDKIRVVFDCSYRYQGTSLNDELLQGPDLRSSLVGVLTRFRQENVAFMGDIEGMYHQVRVPENQRNYLRFLWWPDGDISRDLEEYQMNVHLFGATSSPSRSNYSLRRAAEEFGDGYESCSTINRNFYVDDCLKSEETEEKAIKRIEEVTSICAKGGFHLTKFVSNKRTVLQSITEQDRAKDIKELDLNIHELPVKRCLGIHWNIENDTFGFRIQLQDKPLTRRGILSTISSIFDPLGIAAPVILQGKKILQELCQTNCEWDDEIPVEYKTRWEKWKNQLPLLQTFTMKRCFKPESFGKVVSQQIHCFSDASTLGYGHVSYLRQVNENGEIHCAFLIGKARLAPLKIITIPRLELTAAVLSARIGTTTLKKLDLPVDRQKYWTDSQTVLRYINNEKTRFHVFVSNPVQVIRNLTDCKQWKYVEGNLNPADEGSRGLSVKQFVDQARWVTGPEFLWRPESKWSQDKINLEITDDPEVTSAFATGVNIKDDMLERFGYFSCWNRLKSAIAWILRLLDRVKATDAVKTSLKPLTVEEMKRAEIAILKIYQRVTYLDEIKRLKEIDLKKLDDRSKKKQIKRSSFLYQLDPFLDPNGILRVGARLRKSEELDEEAKHPNILPKNGHITDLIIRQAHHRIGHAGRGMTLSEVRNRFWVTKANSAVRRYITNCVTCKRLRGAVGEQKLSDLPQLD